MEALDELMSVLCDPEGNVCILGSGKDREIIQQSLAALHARLAEVKQRSRSRAKRVADRMYTLTRALEFASEEVNRHHTRTTSAEAHVERLEAAIRESSEYLSRNNLNSIESGSLLHQRMQAALAECEEGR